MLNIELEELPEIVLEIYFDSETLYLTEKKNKTLSGQLYSAILTGIDFGAKVMPLTGGLGTVSTLNFNIPENNGLAYFDDNVSTFYNTSFPFNRLVKCGLINPDSGSQADIVWAGLFYIKNINHPLRLMQFDCFEYSFFRNKLVGYNKIKTVNNYDEGRGGYVSATTTEGETIPILYGSHTVLGNPYEIDKMLLAPGLLVDASRLRYLICGHKQIFDTIEVYKYLEPIESFMKLTGNTVDIENEELGLKAKLLGTGATPYILGELYWRKVRIGSASTIYNNVENLFDNDDTTYITLPAGETISVVCDGDLSTSQLGVFDSQDSFNLHFTLNWGTDVDTEVRNATIGLKYRSSWSDSATTAISTDKLSDSDLLEVADSSTLNPRGQLPWTVEDLYDVEFVVTNTNATEDIRVFSMHVYIKDIMVQTRNYDYSKLRNQGGRG